MPNNSRTLFGIVTWPFDVTVVAMINWYYPCEYGITIPELNKMELDGINNGVRHHYFTRQTKKLRNGSRRFSTDLNSGYTQRPSLKRHVCKTDLAHLFGKCLGTRKVPNTVQQITICR